jgi:hypothetical protein
VTENLEEKIQWGKIKGERDTQVFQVLIGVRYAGWAAAV